MCTYTCANGYACVCIHVHAHVQTCMYICLFVCMYTHVCLYLYICVCMSVCKYLYQGVHRSLNEALASDELFLPTRRRGWMTCAPSGRQSSEVSGNLGMGSRLPLESLGIASS